MVYEFHASEYPFLNIFTLICCDRNKFCCQITFTRDSNLFSNISSFSTNPLRVVKGKNELCFISHIRIQIHIYMSKTKPQTAQLPKFQDNNLDSVFTISPKCAFVVNGNF